LKEKAIPKFGRCASLWVAQNLFGKNIRAVKSERVNLIYSKAVEKDSYPEDCQGHCYFAGPIAIPSNTCQN